MGRQEKIKFKLGFIELDIKSSSKVALIVVGVVINFLMYIYSREHFIVTSILICVILIVGLFLVHSQHTARTV